MPKVTRSPVSQHRMTFKPRRRTHDCSPSEDATSARDATQENNGTCARHAQCLAHVSVAALLVRMTSQSPRETRRSEALLNGTLRRISAFGAPSVTHPKVLPQDPQWVCPEGPKGLWLARRSPHD